MLKAATMVKTDCKMEEVLGYHADAEMFPKAASERAQTMMSENRYIYPRIDFLGQSPLVSTGNNVRTTFLVHQVSNTSTTVLWFSLCVSMSDYTCHLMTANLALRA